MPFRCECGESIPCELLQRHLNQCQLMLTKYCKLVREYVALKQDAIKDEMTKLQALNNIMTLN